MRAGSARWRYCRPDRHGGGAGRRSRFVLLHLCPLPRRSREDLRDSSGCVAGIRIASQRIRSRSQSHSQSPRAPAVAARTGRRIARMRTQSSQRHRIGSARFGSPARPLGFSCRCSPRSPPSSCDRKKRSMTKFGPSCSLSAFCHSSTPGPISPRWASRAGGCAAGCRATSCSTPWWTLSPPSRSCSCWHSRSSPRSTSCAPAAARRSSTCPPCSPMRTAPGQYWWLGFMLFSTLLPTLIHLAIGAFALFTLVSGWLGRPIAAGLLKGDSPEAGSPASRSRSAPRWPSGRRSSFCGSSSRRPGRRCSRACLTPANGSTPPLEMRSRAGPGDGPTELHPGRCGIAPDPGGRTRSAGHLSRPACHTFPPG